MELELGLAISNNGPTKIPISKELDLISYVNYKGKQQVCYEDDNCSTLSCQSSINDGDYGEEEVINDGFSLIKEDSKKIKRGFSEVIEVKSCVLSLPKTLPLLLWDKHPNEDDQLPKRLCNSAFVMNKNECDSLVGWPPIKTHRKKLNDAQHYQHHHNNHQRRRHGGSFPAIDNGGRGGSRSMFIKVQIEGFFIKRKIDLKLFHSYEALITSLLTMFGKGQDNRDDYKLTYQDRDGDWLLTGDVPWRTFIESVQRLKLRRRDD